MKVGAVKLRGIVEADETFVLRSRKCECKLDRKPRRRGGAAAKRGLSKEQVPILVGVDRSGTTITGVLADVNADNLKARLGPVIDKHALLVIDGASSYPPCAAALGIAHEVLDRRAGERVRGDLHLQTVDSRHERLEAFLRRHRGIAPNTSTAISPGITSPPFAPIGTRIRRQPDPSKRTSLHCQRQLSQTQTPWQNA